MTKDEAIRRIMEHKFIHKLHEPRARKISEALDMAIKALSADRPQGRNLSEEYPSLFECSVCGASCSDTIPWDCDINYCPNCGAKMKGADDDYD